MDISPSKQTILVVDDSEVTTAVLNRILSKDYHVEIANKGGDAIKIANSPEPPDLILLDLIMPDLNGYEVCQRLKANNSTKNIPVIFVTASDEIDHEAKGFEVGGVDYITKPIRSRTVRARVKNQLELKLAQQELKKQNEILLENARLRDEVEQMVRHDLKTPLHTVVNVPGMLMKDENLTADQVEMLQMLEESGYRMLDLINSTLDLFKMETGKYELRSVPVDLLQIVNQIRGETRDLVSSKNISVEVTVRRKPISQSDSFVVHGEEMLFYSMMANLVKNAVEASPEGETITILFEDEDSPVVRIHNKGEVPREIRNNFFDKYVTSGKPGGTGLGTYSARLMAETLGGSIHLNSAEDMGTTLTIKLPEYEINAHKEDTLPSRGKTGTLLKSNLKILIVDDYVNMRRTIQGILRQMGFNNFRHAEDGREAVSVLKAEKIDLIIGDWNMPKMTGIELLQFVRASEALKNIPFIMVTGEATRETIVEAAKAQVSGYLLKPFPADILIKKIEEVVS
ncbi:MAG: response regulator [Deltaproteobacteria bacterium]|nr:response regulator [Deltaproteobacteria bacterium]